jgi:hypothetical protein
MVNVKTFAVPDVSVESVADTNAADQGVDA